MKIITEALQFYLLRQGKTIACLLLAIFSLLSAEAQNQTGKKTVTSSIWYYEYLPPDYNSNTNKYPVVIFLHGTGEKGNDEASLPAVAKNGPPKHVKNGFKFPFILISPQLKSNYGNWPIGYVDEVLEYVKTYLRIDLSRVYLTGLSLGGGGTWLYAQDPVFVKKLAAIAPCCGSANSTSKACILAAQNLPVWAFHGDADGTVHFHKSLFMVEAINACVPAPNPLAIITIYPGVGHSSWNNAYLTDNSLHNPNVYQWLMQWKKGGVTVNAGLDINLNAPPSSTNITGTATTSSGSITSYAWTKVSGPAATITNASSPTVSLSGLGAGVYTFRLTATNSAGENASDDVKVTVLATNLSPTANAGADVPITLPTNSLNLIGSGTDTDGTIASYAWTKVSGPASNPTLTLTGANTATLGISNLIQGTYVFSLLVTDNLGATGTDQVTIVVSPAAANQLPTANAGLDKILNQPPISSTNLVGSGSDPDGTITTYLWVKVSGPSVTLTNANTATVSLSGLLPGVYTFQLTVTDNQAATASDQVIITVVAANQSPIANAGGDVTITFPTSVTTLTGSGSDPDGSISIYAWTQISGTFTATLVNASTTTVTLNGLVGGETYGMRLTVTDNNGSTGFDDVLVIVNSAPANVPPTANAGTDITIPESVNSVVLNGLGNDTDGTIASFVWQLVSGPPADLSNLNSADLTASNLVPGTYTFNLTVTDNQGASASDNVIVIVQPNAVNQAPVADAGADVTLTWPTNSVLLNGSGTDTDGTITTYNWIQTSGLLDAVLTGATSASLQITNLSEGIYIFQLTVTDNDGATDSEDVTVTVNTTNTPPTADAGLDITLNLPVNFTDITGSGIDVDGTIASYLWTEVSRPSGSLPSTLVGDNTNKVSVSSLDPGTYTFKLTVTDNDGDTGSDDVKVIVNAANLTPTANAGPNKIITLPTTSANFTGSGIDPDGTIVSYLWTQVVGPFSANLTNSSSQTVTVTVPANGNGFYKFRLVVTDNNGATDFDEVNLNVKAAAVNQAPTANAGTNQSITLPVNSLNLVGSGSDPDGSIAAYLWTKINGPSTFILTNSTSATALLNNLGEGIYTFRLTVTDNLGLQGSADVTVSVSAASVNQAPIANAGANQSITSPPTNSITLLGSGSDADGTVSSYTWTKLSALAATLTNASTPNLSLSALDFGVHSFRLTVTDNNGATGTDDVTVTVNAVAVNQLPIANAGTDITMSWPTNSTNIIGSGSDADGSITLYTWIKVSGPTVTLGVTNLATLGISNLVNGGSYVFRLEVKDNNGAIDTDDVNVTVLPSGTNQTPTANAGSDITVLETVSTVLISGNASDADGTLTVLWTQVAGGPVTLVNETTTALTVNGLAIGVYRFRLTATDNQSASAFDEVIVTVNALSVNQLPVANAGTDKTIKLPVNSITLTGTGTDPDGTIATFQWLKISGPIIIMPLGNTADLALTGLAEGIYTFSLTVTDNLGATNTDNVIVTVLPNSINVPPSVDAGGDKVIQFPTSTATLTSSATDDSVNPILFSWTKLSGSTTVILAGENTNTLMLSNLEVGEYVFRITVTDDGGLTDFDDIMVTVLPGTSTALPPTVDAGGDIQLQLPNDDLAVVALAEAPDGLIEKYKWTQVVGQPVTIDPDTTSLLSISNLAPGNYTFKIQVTDGNGVTAEDEVSVTVLEEEPAAKPRNLFSPDNKGDVSSETWTIENADLLVDCDITVYNRQGQKVYSSIGYQTKWDGTSNGKPLPDGAYFYVIRCSGKRSQTGSVTIARLK